MRATGYPQKAMLSAVLTVGMNIILAPIFIFWLKWGIRGAAIATVLSQCVGMVWVLSHFRNPKSTVHFRQGTFRLRWKIVSSIFSIGMSPFLLNVCACLVTVLINIGLKRYGGDMAIGAFGILNRILILFVMLVMGLTQGMQPLVGYNYGAQQFERVKQTLKYGVITGGLITTAGFLAGQFAPEIVSRMFTDDAGLIALSVEEMCIRDRNHSPLDREETLWHKTASIRRDGGIGRRSGLKIRRWQHLASSSLAPGTRMK